MEAEQLLLAEYKVYSEAASLTSSATFVNSRIIRHAQITSRWQSESSRTILRHHDA